MGWISILALFFLRHSRLFAPPAAHFTHFNLPEFACLLPELMLIKLR